MHFWTIMVAFFSWKGISVFVGLYILDRSPLTSPSQSNTETSLTPRLHLQSLINLTSMFWTARGTWSTQREPTHAKGDHAHSTQKDLSRGWNHEPSCCETTALIAKPLCCLKQFLYWNFVLVFSLVFKFPAKIVFRCQTSLN